MTHWNWRRFFMTLLIGLVGLGMIGGCHSGEKMVDEVTGNRAVTQYHKSKKDMEKMNEQQAERYESIPADEKEDEKQ